MVCAAWLAIQMTGRADSIGILLGMSSLLGLVTARMTGRFVLNAVSKKRVVVVSHIGMTCFALMPALSVWMTFARPFWTLVVVCCAMTCFTQTCGSGTDYFIKQLACKGPLRRRIATLASLTQMSMVCGTGLAGWALIRLDFATLFAGIAALCAASAILAAVGLPSKLGRTAFGELECATPVITLHKAAYSEVISHTGNEGSHRPALIVVMSYAALAYAVGQLTNVLLPGLIQLTRSGSSLQYASLEISWAIGALLASATLAVWRARAPTYFLADIGIVAMLALLLALVPIAAETATLVALHFLLGMGFSAARVGAETRFLTTCPEKTLGTARATMNMLVHGVALAAFALPIVASGWRTDSLYWIGSAVVGAGATGLLIAWHGARRRAESFFR